VVLQQDDLVEFKEFAAAGLDGCAEKGCASVLETHHRPPVQKQAGNIVKITQRPAAVAAQVDDYAVEGVDGFLVILNISLGDMVKIGDTQEAGFGGRFLLPRFARDGRHTLLGRLELDGRVQESVPIVVDLPQPVKEHADYHFVEIAAEVFVRFLVYGVLEQRRQRLGVGVVVGDEVFKGDVAVIGVHHIKQRAAKYKSRDKKRYKQTFVAFYFYFVL
jgi:hypothetical protein